MSLVMSPNPAAFGSPIRFTVKIVLSAPVTNLRFHLEKSAPIISGECHPSDKCAYNADGMPYWIYPSASGTVKATFDTFAQPTATVRLFNDAGISTSGSKSVHEKLPTLTAKVSVADTGAIMPGDILKVTTGASTNAGPVPGTLQLQLPAGVGAPTSIPGDANYDAGAHRVERHVTADLSATYNVLVPVTGGIGTKLTFTTNFFPDVGANPVSRKRTYTVGQPVSTPKPTPRPTPKPTPRATARASDAATQPAPSALPSPPSPASVGPTESGQDRPSVAASATPSPATAQAGGTAGQSGSPPPASPASTDVATFTGATVLVVVLCFLGFRLLRPRLRP
jgi:hypothetical protein